MFPEFVSFLRALFKNWRALLLGGGIAIALMLWQWFGSPLGRIWYGVILIVTFFPAFYLTWRDEYRRANKAVLENSNLKNAARAAALQNQSALWKPSATLQNQTIGSELRNELILKDSKNFELSSVELLSPTGAKLADVPIAPGQISTGFRVHIPHSDILKLWKLRYTSGSIRYCVRCGDAPYIGTIHFEADSTSVVTSNGRWDWIRLIG